MLQHPPMNEDMIQLQELISHQGADIERLSHELFAQQQEIERLELKVAKLEAQVKHINQQQPHTRSIDEETPPPHY